MSDVSDTELFSAYLDGELTADEQVRVEQTLATSPEARQMLEELRALGSTLQSLPQQKLDESLAARVLQVAERRMLSPEEANVSGTLRVPPEDGTRSVPDTLDKPSAGRAAASLTTAAGDSTKPEGFPWRELSWRGMFTPRALVWSALIILVGLIIRFNSPPEKPNQNFAKNDETKSAAPAADAKKRDRATRDESWEAPAGQSRNRENEKLSKQANDLHDAPADVERRLVAKDAGPEGERAKIAEAGKTALEREEHRGELQSQGARKAGPMLAKKEADSAKEEAAPKQLGDGSVSSHAMKAPEKPASPPSPPSAGSLAVAQPANGPMGRASVAAGTAAPAASGLALRDGGEHAKMVSNSKAGALDKAKGAAGDDYGAVHGHQESVAAGEKKQDKRQVVQQEKPRDEPKAMGEDQPPPAVAMAFKPGEVSSRPVAPAKSDAAKSSDRKAGNEGRDESLGIAFAAPPATVVYCNVTSAAVKARVLNEVLARNNLAARESNEGGRPTHQVSQNAAAAPVMQVQQSAAKYDDAKPDDANKNAPGKVAGATRGAQQSAGGGFGGGAQQPLAPAAPAASPTVKPDIVQSSVDQSNVAQPNFAQSEVLQADNSRSASLHFECDASPAQLSAVLKEIRQRSDAFSAPQVVTPNGQTAHNMRRGTNGQDAYRYQYYAAKGAAAPASGGKAPSQDAPAPPAPADPQSLQADKLKEQDQQYGVKQADGAAASPAATPVPAATTPAPARAPGAAVTTHVVFVLNVVEQVSPPAASAPAPAAMPAPSAQPAAPLPSK